MWTKRTKLVLAVISRSVGRPRREGRDGPSLPAGVYLYRFNMTPHWHSITGASPDNGRRQRGFPPAVVLFISKKRPVLIDSFFCAHPLNASKTFKSKESHLRRVLYGLHVLSISSDFVSVDRPPHPLFLPPPPTVLSITSTPIVCVVLTRQGINLGAFNACILECIFSERRESLWPSCRLPPPKGHFGSLCPLTLRTCVLLHCECNV